MAEVQPEPAALMDGSDKNGSVPLNKAHMRRQLQLSLYKYACPGKQVSLAYGPCSTLYSPRGSRGATVCERL
jgi:hypothetical protein